MAARRRGSISIFPISSKASITATGAAFVNSDSSAGSLRTQTINSAIAMFRDDEVGSIEVGKRANVVVLSHDPTLVDAEYTREMQVQQTYVDGVLLYSV